VAQLGLTKNVRKLRANLVKCGKEADKLEELGYVNY
jgi:hypothetical protein